MAANATTVEDTLDGADGLPPKRGFSGKKLVLLVLLPLLLLGGGAGALIATGIVDLGGDGEAGEARPAPPRKLVFYDLPDLLVNLAPTGRRTNYLKIRVSLEVESEADVQKLQALSPRIIDNFQVYLRELRVADLQGSAGMARLREELLRRVGAAVEPIKVHDVLFREMLVQ
ncbi:MAG: flagellar basal body-associated FliL family protein [Alphaproteobacteria bacterium]